MKRFFIIFPVIAIFATLCGCFGESESDSETVAPPQTIQASPIAKSPPDNVDLQSDLSEKDIKIAVSDLFGRYDKVKRYSIYLEWDQAMQSSKEGEDSMISAQVMGKHAISNLQLMIIQREGMKTDIANMSANIPK